MTAAQRFAAGGVTLAVGAVTDVGLKRKHNEDSILALPAIYVVADGMGGYEAGDQASQAVISAFEEVATGRDAMTLDLIRDALELADDGVAEVAEATSRGAGSTVAGIAIVEGASGAEWVIFHVGDSRVYRHLGATLQQVTIDHSLGQELYQAGRITAEELAIFPDRNVITRAIGAADAEADSWTLPVMNGERFLICSDGLSGEVPDELIRSTLAGGGDAGDLADTLVELAKRGGGKDNISVIIVEVLAGGGDFDEDDLVAAGADEDPDTFLNETTEPAATHR